MRAADPTGRPRRTASGPKPGVTRMFATAVPGLAPVVARELAELPGIAVHGTGFDGRSDVILFEAARGGRGAARSRGAALALSSAEDVFVEVGRAQRTDGDRPNRIAGRMWPPDAVQRALSIWAEEVRPLRGSMTFRVVTRVLQERSFLRTDLRQWLTEIIQRDRPKWRFADPALLEVWATEYQPGRLVAGLRLSDATMRQHNGRAVERAGALRPTVAGAMVLLAGPPDGLLLDPCCGAGTILREARVAGWQPRGGDIDPEAVRAARENVPDAEVALADARRLDLPDGSVGAYVSNLPFGRQYTVDGGPEAWLRAVLAEAVRVTRPGGRVVLLVPELPRAVVPAALRPAERLPVRLLGLPTTLWVYGRAR